MVSDSNMSDGERVWKARKVHRIRGCLLGLAGHVDEINGFLDWYRAGEPETGYPKLAFENSVVLALDPDGLWLFDSSCTQWSKVPTGREAIGTGGVAAISAYEALDWTDPARAVRIACKHDAGSRVPVRTYRL